MAEHDTLWTAINDLRDQIDSRLRRLEYMVIGLIVVTGVRVAGLSINEVGTAVVSTLGFVGSLILGAVLGVIGILAALRGN